MFCRLHGILCNMDESEKMKYPCIDSTWKILRSGCNIFLRLCGWNIYWDWVVGVLCLAIVICHRIWSMVYYWSSSSSSFIWLEMIWKVAASSSILIKDIPPNIPACILLNQHVASLGEYHSYYSLLIIVNSLFILGLSFHQECICEYFVF